MTRGDEGLQGEVDFPGAPILPHGRYATFRDGARRMAETLAGGSTGVPVYAQLHEFAAHEAGLSGWEFYGNPDLLVTTQLDCELELGLEVASTTFDVYNIEAEALGQPLLLSEEGAPDLDRSHPLVVDASGLRKIRTPDFERDGRFAQVVRMHRLFRELTGLEPTLTFCAPFTLAAGLRGIEPFLMDIHSDRRFARRLVDTVTEEVLAPWISYQRSTFPGAGRVSGADAVASPPIVNLRILEEWALPPIERLRALCGDGVYVANWAGERLLRDPVRMMDLRLRANSFWTQGQDPDVEILGPDLYKTYARAHDVPLILGIGASFLAQATPDEVAARVRHYIAAGTQDGRLALYLCNAGANTPRANLIAAIEAAKA